MRVHFIGLGGIGMSGIARLHLEAGDRVQGSDIKKGPILEDLERRGAKVFIGHDGAHVAGADLVVYSTAVPGTHPERVEAMRRGIRVVHRAEALEAFCRGKATLAVAGTHGKTTTTALLAMMLVEAGRDPSVVVGGWVEDLGGNAVAGKGREIVIEADESDSSFLRFSPDVAVVTNIEPEHLDHFGSARRMEKAFEDFIGRVKPGGRWFGCAEDTGVRALAEKTRSGILYGFGRRAAGPWAENVVECPQGKRGVSFDVWDGPEKLGGVSMRLVGRHNVLNALGAIGAARTLGVEFSRIASALARFGGTGRRFDVKFEDPEYLVVDDYAHHPTEIEKTLAAARGLHKNRIVALFQPHRYSRTELLMKDFAGCFSGADKLILTDIYAASEAPRRDVSGRKLFETVRMAGHPDVSFAGREELADAARAQLKPGDLVLVMGAGDITQVAAQLSECLRRNGSFGELFAGLKGRVLREEPLSKHTTLRIGGPAEFWVEPADEEDLRQALSTAARHGLRVNVLGAGSNVLAADEGVRGVVIHLGSPYFKQVSVEGDSLRARTGVPNTLFIQTALEAGFGGFEFLSGIPGNIGGALAMNAGSHGRSIAPYVESVRTMDPAGTAHERSQPELAFSYRHCGLKNEIFLEARLRFPRVPRGEVQKVLDGYRDHRMSTQDLQHPSAGCLFKNPVTPGCSAGRLIDEAGLKGLTVGGVQVSPKHANFIVNLGGARAVDVLQVIDTVRRAVRAKHGVELETEVKVLR